MKEALQTKGSYMIQYQIESLSQTKQVWPIREFSYIGCDQICKIQIQGENIEARHAKIEIKSKNLYIRDLRSQSGTFVNGASVIEAILKDGDIITIGALSLVVTDLQIIKKNFPMSSRSEYWHEQLKTLANVALTKYPILLLGPSGSGKDILAQSIHQNSLQAPFAFLSVNCSALTETLIESELFGHVKGSFTGAISDRKGAFESARGGTLFLDEIGDLPYSLQSKLLRALENNEIRPVGSDRIVKTNVRILSATHQNLYQKIREGSFRSDLYYRLNVITIEVPSLKERIEDFEDLIYQFARQMKVRFSHNALQLLKKHDWNGNIRELKNIVSRAAALFPKEYIVEKHIDILLNKKEKLAHVPTGITYSTNPNAQMSVIKEIEKQMILKRLAANQGNQKRTAVDLGMPKSTLHDRIKNYNIRTEQFRA